ncbi:SDR family oxidoreductase [Catellatospora bangladeshensis]|uniref:Oxidoreductase n=1 Tax=Catellatospora bangladeshensis TaxID=310355 RepID=A0A8J3JQ61_9ACTN|nr:SDR family oxidoreductase [Catellatospora bangladeshensis]GIF84901.1 oxidoreductase [Catellatospora bangladeshensis]
MTPRLSGQVVLVTGAARGIGEYTARLAAAHGARLALVGLEPDRLRLLADELDAAHGDGTAAWFAADVTDSAALDRAVAGTLAAFGRIDAVVANAGVASLGTVAAGDIGALARTVEVNLIGVMRTVAATAAPVIAARGYYLLVSSTAAFAALPGMSAYCAAKAGVEHFGTALRLELAHHGVGVGTAHPGWIDTDLVRDARADLPSFRDSFRAMPWPVGSITSVERCARAFVRGVERRRRRVYVPRAIAGVHWLRTLISSRLADALVGRRSRVLVPRMEQEVAALGRSFGVHSTGTGQEAA